MKRLSLLTLIIIFVGLAFWATSGLSMSVVNAVTPTTPAPTMKPLDPFELVIDTTCLKAIIEGKAIDSTTNEPTCNRYCQRKILYMSPDYTTPSGNYCVFSFTDKVATDSTGKVLTLELIAPLQPLAEDTVLIYIRGGIYLIMGGSSLAVILYGLYGWYLRAMSEGNPEKVAESVKVYKNAIIGIIIIFSALVITQLLFLFLGITDGPFDFNFIPKAGYLVDVTDADLGRFCFSNQMDKNKTYTCDPTTNKWIK